LRLFGLSSLALVAGCNWVSPEDLDARLGQLDDDGDGFTRDGNGDPARVDCDDTNAAIYPGAAEVWYDGVDQNCDRLNDFDQDGDGVVIEGCADPLDCRPEIPGGDCDDLNAEVFPAAVDEWYDGLDSNCDVANDFDQDADGFVIDGCADPVYCGATVPGGDCDDLVGGVNPGEKEVYYDGLDADCDGASDFDADSDGHDSDEHGGRDCNDTTDRISPSADDDWYDGVDQDCDGANDFDQDGDGLVIKGCINSTYCGADVPGGDCDDTDETIFPLAQEDVQDSVDSDCDGGADSFALALSSNTFASGVDLAAGEWQDQVYFSMGVGYAAWVGDDGPDETWDATVASAYSVLPPWLNFIEAADYSIDVVETLPWGAERTMDPSFTITSGQSFSVETVDGRDWICGGSGLLYGTSRGLSTTCFQLSKSGGTSSTRRRSVSFGESDTVSDLDDITTARDADGDFHTLGCSSTDGGSLQYLVVSELGLEAGTSLASQLFTDVSMLACAAHFLAPGGEGTLIYLDGVTNEYVVATWDPTAPETYSGGFSGLFTETYRGTTSIADLIVPTGATTPIEMVMTISGGLIVYEGGLATGTARSVLGATAVRDADLALGPGGELFAVWLDSLGKVRVSFGQIGTGFTSSAKVTTPFTPTEVTAWYTATGYLFVAATDGSALAVGVIEPP
jgi:hypothetical protein